MRRPEKAAEESGLGHSPNTRTRPALAGVPDAEHERETRFVIALKAGFLTILRGSLAHPFIVVASALLGTDSLDALLERLR